MAVKKNQGLYDQKIFPSRLLKKCLEVFAVEFVLAVGEVVIATVKVHGYCMTWGTPIVVGHAIFM